MFCDLVNSTSLAAQLDPEEFTALLLAYRDICVAAIRRHGGHVQHYMGDGIMACFGFPRALGRDAQAAVRCALEIGRRIESSALRSSNGELITVRIGIESGLVIAGRIGKGVSEEIDAFIGPAPNAAAKLQSLAAPNGVVIGGATHGLVAADFACREVSAETLALPGQQRAFEVFPAGSGVAPAPPRRQAPLIGRDTELVLLAARWRRAASGHGQVVLLSGEAGIGKSRLVRELAELASAPLDKGHPVVPAVITLACAPQATTTTLFPVLEVLRTVAGIGHATTPEQAMPLLEAIAAKCAMLPEECVPVLAEALGLGPEPVGRDPKAKRRSLLRALETWLLHEAETRPLLLVVEDLHWADPSLIELLRNLGDQVARLPVLLLLTYRSDFVLPWPDRASVLRVALSPLSAVESDKLIDSLDHAAGAEARRAILSRAEGVPLFIEEFLLAAESAELPQTLQQLFIARLDSLGEARPVAQRAAVLGRAIDRELLAALCDHAEEKLDSLLGVLVAAEVIDQTGGGQRPGYAFRHALLQQAAHESLLYSERRSLHAEAARLLADLRPQIAERHPEQLAEHWAAAGDHARAVPLFARATRRALNASALAEAEAHATRGVDHAGQLPAASRSDLELELLVLLGHARIARHGYASASVEEAFERALRSNGMVRDVEDDLRIMPLLRGLASFYQVRGPLDRAEMLCTRLVKAAERGGDRLAMVDAWRRLGWNRQCQGRLVEAEQGLQQALNSVDPAHLAEYASVAAQDPRALALANLCWLDLWRHGPAAAVERARQAVDAARASPHPVSGCYALVFAAIALQEAGQWSDAVQYAQEAQAIAEDKGIAYWVAMSRVAIGRDGVARGGRDGALAGRMAMREGLTLYRQTQGEVLLPKILGMIAEAELALGNMTEAAAALKEAIMLAERLGAAGFIPALLLQQAALPDPEPGLREERLRRAIEVADAQGALHIAATARRAAAKG